MVGGLMNKAISIVLAATVFFILASTILIDHFNATYNKTVTGLSSSTLQGLMLLVFVLAVIGIAVAFLPKTR